jgi:hypothetical protein
LLVLLIICGLGSTDGIKLSIVPGGLVGNDNDLEDEDGKSNKDESKNLSASESSEETIVDISAAHEGGSSVGVDGNSHSNVSGSNGGSGSNDVGSGSVWEVGWSNIRGHLLHVDGNSEEDSEGSREDTKVQIFLA